MFNVSPWLLLLLGIFLGWVATWLLDLWYFRAPEKGGVGDIARLETDLRQKVHRLDEAESRIQVLQSELRARKNQVAALRSAVTVQASAPKADPVLVADSGPDPEVRVGQTNVALPVRDMIQDPEVQASSGQSRDTIAPSFEGGIALSTQTTPAALAAVTSGRPKSTAVAAASDSKSEMTVLVAGTADDSRSEDNEEPSEEVDSFEFPYVSVQPEEEESPANSFRTADQDDAAQGLIAPTDGRSLAQQDEVNGQAAKVAIAAAFASEEDHADLEEALLIDLFVKIKGIGPGYAKALVAAGVTTYEGLAHLSDSEIEAIVDPPYWQVVDYDSWRQQASALAVATPRPGVVDQLTKIEGIGPHYAKLLEEAGLTSFEQLASSTEEALAEIIQAPQWRRVRYAEWIEQAQLAVSGDLQTLSNRQREFHAREQNKLTLIAGLGSKSEQALLMGGIESFADLAEATPEDLDRMMKDAGLRAANYESWISEAKLRADGKRVSSRRNPRRTN